MLALLSLYNFVLVCLTTYFILNAGAFGLQPHPYFG